MEEQAAQLTQHLNTLYGLFIEWGPKVIGAIKGLGGGKGLLGSIF